MLDIRVKNVPTHKLSAKFLYPNLFSIVLNTTGPKWTHMLGMHVIYLHTKYNIQTSISTNVIERKLFFRNSDSGLDPTIKQVLHTILLDAYHDWSMQLLKVTETSLWRRTQI